MLDWWKDVDSGDSFQPPIRAPTRGSIFRDEQLYADHARWSVASYLLIPQPTFVLDPAKEVGLSPRELCLAQPMSLEPLFHSLHHWYYPPLVKDFVADLETAARGYCNRLDMFRPTKEHKRSFDKMQNKKNDEGMHILYFSSSYTNVSCIVTDAPFSRLFWKLLSLDMIKVAHDRGIVHMIITRARTSLDRT